jgi:glyoxylase-like metal-dependent hydrolase (beta-lactamase superfamily II)
VDPQRDISQYVATAGAHGLTIERVIETHFHADFLSGHLELKEATGATISYGSVAADPPDAVSPQHPGRTATRGRAEAA